MTGRRVVVVPYGDAQTLLEAARRFGVDYVFLEQDGLPAPLRDLYDDPDECPGLIPLGVVDENQVFFVEPSP